MQVEGQTEDELVFLLAHDKDAFCRWEAGQRILRGLLTSLYTAASASKVASVTRLPCHARCCQAFWLATL